MNQQDELVPIEFCDLYDLLMTVGELHPQVLESVLHKVNGEKFPSVPLDTPMIKVLREKRIKQEDSSRKDLEPFHFNCGWREEVYREIMRE